MSDLVRKEDVDALFDVRIQEAGAGIAFYEGQEDSAMADVWRRVKSRLEAAQDAIRALPATPPAGEVETWCKAASMAREWAAEASLDGADDAIIKELNDFGDACSTNAARATTKDTPT